MPLRNQKMRTFIPMFKMLRRADRRAEGVKAPATKIQRPEFKSQDTHDRERTLTPSSCPLTCAYLPVD